MKITVTKAKGITLDGKGYLVGINNIYVLDGSMFNFKYKKYAIKFIKRILEELKTNKNIIEVMRKEYNNYLSIESKYSKEAILDRIKLEYYKTNTWLNDYNQLIAFAKENLKDLNIKNLNDYLYYCN